MRLWDWSAVHLCSRILPVLPDEVWELFLFSVNFRLCLENFRCLLNVAVASIVTSQQRDLNMKRNGITLNYMKWHEMTWNDMKWHEMTWNDMKWHEMTWNDMKLHEMTWNDMKCNKKRWKWRVYQLLTEFFWRISKKQNLVKLSLV